MSKVRKETFMAERIWLDGTTLCCLANLFTWWSEHCIAPQRIASKAVLNTKASLFQALLKPSLQIEVPSGREKQESMNHKHNEHKSEWGPGSVATKGVKQNDERQYEVQRKEAFGGLSFKYYICGCS